MIEHQREQLIKTISWAREISADLGEIQDQHGVRVHFRPSSNGIAMVGLLPSRPQRGKTGLKETKRIVQDFDTLFQKYCRNIEQGRATPEKELQSFLISTSHQNERQMEPINKVCRDRKLVFVTDEIPLPHGTKKIVCDLLAVHQDEERFIPVLLELKSDRAMARLIEQVETYSRLIDLHSDLYEELFSVLLRTDVQFYGPCEKWIVWPMAGQDKDPRETELAARGIRVVGYEQEAGGFSFRVGDQPILFG